MIHLGRVTTRAEDAQETPIQSHISPSVLVYEDGKSKWWILGLADRKGALENQERRLRADKATNKIDRAASLGPPRVDRVLSHGLMSWNQGGSTYGIDYGRL